MDSPAEPAPEGATAVKPLRDPQALLLRTRREWGGRGDLWVFGYASLLWRPEFAYDEHRPAFVRGWHRALRMASRINRGTPERPGLVFAMLPGGSCHGGVFRVPRDAAPTVLELLWQREMPTGVYDPRWLPCRTQAGMVPALAFTLPFPRLRPRGMVSYFSSVPCRTQREASPGPTSFHGLAATIRLSSALVKRSSSPSLGVRFRKRASRMVSPLWAHTARCGSRSSRR